MSAYIVSTRPRLPWYLAPSTDRSDEYAAGYDGNQFASRAEAEAAIASLVACGDDFAATTWVAVERTQAQEVAK